MIAQSRFHLATTDIYKRVISVNFPSAAELLHLDNERFGGWLEQMPKYGHFGHAAAATKHQLSHNIMVWRYRNLRIIMYRPFVIRHALQARTGSKFEAISADTQKAIDRCLLEAQATIYSIQSYWSEGAHHRMAAWYTLYAEPTAVFSATH